MFRPWTATATTTTLEIRAGAMEEANVNQKRILKVSPKCRQRSYLEIFPSTHSDANGRKGFQLK